MDEFFVSAISYDDTKRVEAWERFLRREGISRDRHLDHTIGLFDREHNLVATGSCFANTLRCLAVGREHRGEGLLAKVVSHLLAHLASKGISHVFLYTRHDNAEFFRGLGFSEIDASTHEVVFMENRRDGFSSYLAELTRHRREGSVAAVVMNCNPFTLGHRKLIGTAARQNSFLFVFVVSEDVSFFPYHDRLALIASDIADMGVNNAELHPTGSYIISNAVFPSYFTADDESAIRAQARLDVGIFKKIAASLGVTGRYAGTEPSSRVTAIYNEVMRNELPASGIEFIEIPRAEIDGEPISASRVRELIKSGDLDAVRKLVPKCTYNYLVSEAGRDVAKKIREAASVKHY
ncbi:MAG: [citrate (pro-3S)-lyase] ligase [Synergistaceae bacterium]|nr:[citrate (pro-3S)-lyase] ligase [Synergistaceae bacterium]